MKLLVKNFEIGEEQKAVIESIKIAVANISKVNFYDSTTDTKVMCDESHNCLEATLERKKDEGDWAPISFASRF